MTTSLCVCMCVKLVIASIAPPHTLSSFRYVNLIKITVNCLCITFPLTPASPHDSRTVALTHCLFLKLKISKVRKISPVSNYHYVYGGWFSISHPFNPREDAVCTGPAMLFSANFTAYDSLSWLLLITFTEEDVNYFLLRVRFNFKHLHTLTINMYCIGISPQDSYLPFKTL